MLSLELLDEVVDESIVEVFAAQVGVTSSRFYFENAVFDGENGDIESAAAQVKDKNVAFGTDFFVKTVRNGSCGGFVNDTKNVNSGNCSGVFGCLTLNMTSKDSARLINAV